MFRKKTVRLGFAFLRDHRCFEKQACKKKSVIIPPYVHMTGKPFADHAKKPEWQMGAIQRVQCGQPENIAENRGVFGG